MHERFSDLRAVVIVQSLLRDGGVQFDLTIQNRLYIFYFYLIGKIKDVVDCQFGFIHSSNIVRFIWIIQDYFTVLFDMGDVGVLMLKGATGVNWNDFEEACPAFLIIAMMPFAYSITTGIAAGFLSYVLCKLAARKWRALNVPVVLLALVFLLYLCL